MSSFTDNVQQLTNYNPYIQQQPLKEMLSVGMYKQGQYDQGIEKIQKSFDTVAGMQVSSKHKAYLQSKLNEMGNQMKVLGASDFSNGSLVNSTTSQINSIANDEIVQTGIQSALRQKKELEFMEKAREKGELTPAHLANFQKQNNVWEENDDLKKSYNAKYTNFFDADKLYVDNITKVLPAGTSIDYVYEMNNGKVVLENGVAKLSKTMTRLKQEGRMPESVKAAIELTSNDPRVKQEMSIRGEYEFRNMTSQTLAANIVKTANEDKTDLEDKIDKEYLNLSLDPNNTEIQDKIANLKEGLKKININLQNDAQLIISNPDAVKSSLYNTAIKNSFLKAYSNVKTEQEALKSPLYDQFWEERKFKVDMNFKNNELSARMGDSAANRQNAKAIADGTLAFNYAKLEQETTAKSAKKEEKNSKDSSVNSESGFSENFGKKTYDANVVLDNNAVEASKQFEADRIKFIYKSNFEKNPVNSPILQKLKDSGLSEEAAMTKMLEGTAKKRGVKNFEEFLIKLESESLLSYKNNIGKLSKTNSPLSLVYDNYSKSRITNNSYKEIIKSVDQDELKNYVKDLENFQYITKKVNIGNNSYLMTKQNATDLAVIAKSAELNTSSFDGITKSAIKRLNEEGKGALVSQIQTLTKNNQYLYRNRSGEKKLGKGNDILKNEDFDKRNPVLAGNYKTFLDVFKIADKLNKSVITSDTNKRADIIEKNYIIRPNVTSKVFTGDTKTDPFTETDIRQLVTSYGNSNLATGEGSNRFMQSVNKAKNANDLKNLGINVNIDYDDNGKERVYLVNNLNEQLNINPKEAYKFKAVSSNIFESDRARLEKSKMNRYSGKSIDGDLEDYRTYALKVPSMSNNDFPFLKGTDYTVDVAFTSQLNSETKQTVYFANVCVGNGIGNPKILAPSGPYESVDAMLKGLPQGVTPEKLQKYFK